MPQPTQTQQAHPAHQEPLEIRQTPRGRAVFAPHPYKKNQLIESAPVILGDSHWNDLPDWIGHYVYDWQAIGGQHATVAVALAHGSLFNSSTNANMSFRAAPTNDAIHYHAARDIQQGEELTINYSSQQGEPTSNDNSWFKDRNIPYTE